MIGQTPEEDGKPKPTGMAGQPMAGAKR
jgi:hypothetical protein